MIKKTLSFGFALSGLALAFAGCGGGGGGIENCDTSSPDPDDPACYCDDGSLVAVGGDCVCDTDDPDDPDCDFCDYPENADDPDCDDGPVARPLSIDNFQVTGDFNYDASVDGIEAFFGGSDWIVPYLYLEFVDGSSFQSGNPWRACAVLLIPRNPAESLPLDAHLYDWFVADEDDSADDTESGDGDGDGDSDSGDGDGDGDGDSDSGDGDGDGDSDSGDGDGDGDSDSGDGDGDSDSDSDSGEVSGTTYYQMLYRLDPGQFDVIDAADPNEGILGCLAAEEDPRVGLGGFADGDIEDFILSRSWGAGWSREIDYARAIFEETLDGNPQAGAFFDLFDDGEYHSHGFYFEDPSGNLLGSPLGYGFGAELEADLMPVTETNNEGQEVFVIQDVNNYTYDPDTGMMPQSSAFIRGFGFFYLGITNITGSSSEE